MEYVREINVLLNSIQDAGISIAKIQARHFHTKYKANHEPVTEADTLANDILREQLLTSFPDDGWLSEETVDNDHRMQCKRVWIVDPIDGTKEFVQGLPEYAISVALVENGSPVVCAIYNPITQQLFHAIKSAGAWLNGERIYCDCPYQGKLKILASRTELADGAWDIFMNASDVQPIGSIAYKLALIAAGKAHSTFSLGQKSEWDIAAGVLLIQEAGGIVTDKSYKSFLFNQPNVRVNGIITSTHQTSQLVSHLINNAIRQK